MVFNRVFVSQWQWQLKQSHPVRKLGMQVVIQNWSTFRQSQICHHYIKEHLAVRAYNLLVEFAWSLFLGLNRFVVRFKKSSQSAAIKSRSHQPNFRWKYMGAGKVTNAKAIRGWVYCVERTYREGLFGPSRWVDDVETGEPRCGWKFLWTHRVCWLRPDVWVIQSTTTYCFNELNWLIRKRLKLSPRVQDLTPLAGLCNR